jgi:hypothetical protein
MAGVRGPVDMVKGAAGRERERRELEAMQLRIMAEQARLMREARERNDPLQSPAT